MSLSVELNASLSQTEMSIDENYYTLRPPLSVRLIIDPIVELEPAKQMLCKIQQTAAKFNDAKAASLLEYLRR
jgi:hypothetical protein